MSINALPKDIIEKIGNEVSMQDFINFCITISASNENFCSRDIWNRRFQKDFGFLYPYLSEDQKINIKNTYLDIFILHTKTIEKIFNEIIDWIFGPFRNFLSFDYKPELFDYFYKYLKKVFLSYVEMKDSYQHWREKLFDYNEYQEFKKKFLPKEINFQIPIQNHISFYLENHIKNLEDYLGVMKEGNKRKLMEIILGKRRK